MSTYEDTLLAARFAALAPEPLNGDWDDVLSRGGAARTGRRRLGRADALQGRRRRLLVALAVVVLIAVVSASAFAVRAFFIDKGFIGLPPVGATPSTPKRGELVLSAYGVTRHSRNKVWVYRDGRLIFQRELRPGTKHPPGSANRESTGFLERRLTPAGVELLRSEILSTGLFGHDRELEMARPVPFFNYIHVRNGGRLVRVVWHQDPPYKLEHAYPLATREQATALQRLIARITEPETWLPASAWKDTETRAYVPSRYAVWYGGRERTIEPARLLPLLPGPARNLLGAKGRKRIRGFYNFQGEERVVYTYVSRVTTEEARSFVEALDDAGFEVDWVAEPYVLSYRLEAPAPAGSTVFVTFEPILPHGEWICSACG